MSPHPPYRYGHQGVRSDGTGHMAEFTSKNKKALRLFMAALTEIVGPRSEAYRDLLKAVETDSQMDLLLAQSSFEALPVDVRRRLHERVLELANSDTEEPQATALDNRYADPGST